MKQYFAIIFFALQLPIIQIEAVNIGTDPVGHAQMRGAEEETEENRDAHKQAGKKI